MKNLKKLFAVLAFCACLVIPFTACGGNSIFEKYEITYSEDGSYKTIEFTLKEEYSQNYYYLLTIWDFKLEQYNCNSVQSLFNNEEYLTSIEWQYGIKDNKYSYMRVLPHSTETSTEHISYLVIYESNEVKSDLKTDLNNYIEIIKF